MRSHDEILNLIDALREEVYASKGWKEMPKGYKGPLKYLNRGYHELENLEEYWIKKFKGTKEGKILDFGCGTGRHVYIAKKLGYDIVGLDVNFVKYLKDHELGDLYQRFYKIYDIEENIILTDGVAIPFENNTFDSIFSSIAIAHDATSDESKKHKRINNRIKRLVEISKPRAVWCISRQHSSRIISFFDKYNNKDIKLHAI